MPINSRPDIVPNSNNRFEGHCVLGVVQGSKKRRNIVLINYHSESDLELIIVRPAIETDEYLPLLT